VLLCSSWLQGLHKSLPATSDRASWLLEVSPKTNNKSTVWIRGPSVKLQIEKERLTNASLLFALFQKQMLHYSN
jgi:hypothetical protein